MTRTLNYKDGWHTGRRHAERDLAHGAYDTDVASLTQDAEAFIGSNVRAWVLGYARGYRQTVADFFSGRVTRETFEQAPLGK